MCDKHTCNDASCCGECEPWNCLEQQINDALATKEGELQGYVGEAKEAASDAKASAEASTQSAAESKEFRDEAEQAATTAVAAEGTVIGVAGILQETGESLRRIANQLEDAIAGITVIPYYYTIETNMQTVIVLPAEIKTASVQAIYVDGLRQDPGVDRGFTYVALTRTITLATGLPEGLEIVIMLGTYNADNPDDVFHTLASTNGASLVGTTDGATVQETLTSLIDGRSSEEYQFSPGDVDVDYDLSRLSYGPGHVNYSGVTFKNINVGIAIPNASIYLTPEDAIYGAGIGFGTEGNGNFNVVLSVGAHPETATGFNRSTVVGTNNFTKPIQIDRCDVFGNSALMFMRYGERNTMMGTIAGQWLGTNDPEGDGHELWSNAGGFKPGEPGWDYGGLETANPGIGAKIAAFTAYATTPAECSRNVGVGRDAFNGSIKLLNCTAVGYRASASLINGTNNAAFGTDANRSGLFTTNSTWIGVTAGNSWQEGTRNTVVGYNAAANTITGGFNTLLGSYAGYDFKSLNSCIFIGHGAGNSIAVEDTAPNNILAIGNDVSLVASPLISGNMAAPKVGINILPSKIAATLHVRTTSQVESPVAPSGAADELILENASNTGMTIRSGATGLGAVIFSSPTTASVAGMVYNHSTSALTLRSATGDRWVVTNSAFNPAVDNAYSVGSAALRPSQIFAGTAAINTSDERLKTRLDIEQAEKAAALEIKGNIWKYQFKDANELKDDGGRYHFGVGAQSVAEILKNHGLDLEKYAFYCYDEWDDQYEAVYATRTVSREIENIKEDPVTGYLTKEVTVVDTEEEYDTGEKRLVLAAGNRYGIRYEELLCFIIAAI